MSDTPLFQAKSWPFKTTVYQGYIEYKGIGETKNIPIASISDITKEPLAFIKAVLRLNSGEKIEVIVGNKHLKEFMSVVTSLLNDRGNSHAPASNLNELEKLAQLKDKGIITEEEFQAKKKQILGL